MKKIRLISKFATSQSEKETIEMHVLPSISRNKGNQTIKFGQLIGYNTSNIFLEKSTQILVANLFPDLFQRKSKLKVSLDH